MRLPGISEYLVGTLRDYFANIPVVQWLTFNSGRKSTMRTAFSPRPIGPSAKSRTKRDFNPDLHWPALCAVLMAYLRPRFEMPLAELSRLEATLAMELINDNCAFAAQQRVLQKSAHRII